MFEPLLKIKDKTNKINKFNTIPISNRFKISGLLLFFSNKQMLVGA